MDISHSKINEMQECGKENPFPQVATDPPLTNGHAHLVNGALKPGDLSPVTDEPFIDKKLPERTVKSLGNKPLSLSAHFQTKPDPYEFPHSPPKQCHQAASEQRPKPPPPTYEEALKGVDVTKQQPPSLQVDPHTEKTPSFSATSRSFSHSPIRLNGSHHNAFSSELASLNTNSIADKPDPPIDKSSSFKSSTNLLVQTGDLISEFYSHSRLHQISTWRIGFSEYVNELHSKRKAAGVASFPGKERLRKYVAPRSTECQGRNKRVLMLLLFFVKAVFCHQPLLRNSVLTVS